MAENEEPAIEKQFRAAVNIIQSLPKEGSFKPSNELLLKFYAFFKQATIGQCNIAKPGFWDVVGKAKWDAWNVLGDMTKEEAMQSYVNQILEVIETMPQTDEVTSLTQQLPHFYQLVDIKTGADATPEQLQNSLDSAENLLETEKPYVNGDLVEDPSPPSLDLLSSTQLETANGSTGSLDSDTDSEAYVDSSDQPVAIPDCINQTASDRTVDLLAACNEKPSVRPKTKPPRGEGPSVHFNLEPQPPSTSSQVSEQLRLALLNLQQEVSSLDRRLTTVERISIQQRRKQLDDARQSWWPFPNIEPKAALVILVWPVLVHLFLQYINRRRRRT